MSVNLCPVLGLIITITIVLGFSQALYVPPRIIRESEVESPVLNAGENFNLTCQGSEPLQWIYPEVSVKKRSWTTFRISLAEVPDNYDYIYRSTLHITNMSYPFVGFYTCQYENLLSDKDEIYLYVNDPEALSVNGSDKFNLHYATQYQDTTIPCRPTAPDVQVELTRASTDEKIDYVYDPKTGFTFNVSDISFDDTYSCYFERSDKLVENTYTVQVIQPRAFLATPYIEDRSRNHTEVGQTLTLICYLQVDSKTIRFQWKTPRGQFHADDHNDKNVIVSKSETDMKMGKDYLKSTLTVKYANLKDTGPYQCDVSDRQGNGESSQVYIIIRDQLECSIDIREHNNQPNLILEAGEPAQWILDVMAHPIPELTWFDNKNNIIPKNSDEYFVDFSNDKAIFTIGNPSLDNDGVYRIHGISRRSIQTRSCPQEKEFLVTLTVYDKPSVCLASEGVCLETNNEPPKIYLKNEMAELDCKARGNPLPKITFEVKQCPANECHFIETTGQERPLLEQYSVTQYLRINTSKEGTVKCIASNNLGENEVILPYYISDVKDGFDVFDYELEAIVNKNGTDIEITIAENSTLNFTCGVCPKRSKLLEVFLNNELLMRSDPKHILHTIKSDISINTTVSINKVQLNDSGSYSCRIRNLHDNSFDYRNLTFIVKEPEPPQIWDTNLNEEVLIEYPNMKHVLYCNVSGIPKPTIEWFKDEKIILPSERILMENDGMILNFVYTEVTDEGVYRCEAINFKGVDSKEGTLLFKVKPVSVAIYYYITGLIGLLLLCAIIYILIRRKKEQELRRELKLLGLENFHNGNPENLNPELGIDDQAELLPYNKKWEFPIENLKMGKQLGSGAFGVVMKAEARGIVEGESSTTVAVKMVKKNADQSYIRALASELKIMAHLGKHVNVVNLLGACTKNVAKRELLVIVEFCRFGNLQNYLYKHRESFINQVNPINGNIDFDIGADILERSYSFSSEIGDSVSRPSSMHDYRVRRNTGTSRTHLTGDENVILSNNSIQPEWRVNYRGDYRGDVKPISTRDLITWSFQVARGMEYLASRKVLHGDLAARNILLAENNVVKICDFGLAKTMYNDNNYKKKGDNPMPVKWMAIESIRDRIFSTQSDIWSFGVVLWEIFSLARTPYPGMEADERLYYKLVEGYRMESPMYAPRDMYKIMLDCWNTKPLARPSFTTLSEVIGMLLEDSVRKHYIELNNPCIKINIEKSEGDNDYLGMLSPPSFDVLSTPAPRYANAEVFTPKEHKDAQESGTPEGYLFMGGKQIFSPRLETEDIFRFQTGNKKEPDRESQELKPMLHSNNESDSENGYLTPITPLNSVANPTYNYVPTVQPTKTSEVTKSGDNYVIMPQYKNIVNRTDKDGDAESSVRLGLGKKGANALYVNEDSNMWNSVDV